MEEEKNIPEEKPSAMDNESPPKGVRTTLSNRRIGKKIFRFVDTYWDKWLEGTKQVR